MSEENATSSPSGYNQIPRRARYTLFDEAVAITAMILIVGMGLFTCGMLLVVTWPWGLLAVLGVLNLFGAVVFVLLHRRNSE